MLASPRSGYRGPSGIAERPTIPQRYFDVLKPLPGAPLCRCLRSRAPARAVRHPYPALTLLALGERCPPQDEPGDLGRATRIVADRPAHQLHSTGAKYIELGPNDPIGVGLGRRVLIWSGPQPSAIVQRALPLLTNGRSRPAPPGRLAIRTGRRDRRFAHNLRADDQRGGRPETCKCACEFFDAIPTKWFRRLLLRCSC